MNERKKKSKPIESGTIDVTWRLGELPSSQHKAGLAGLAICVGYLARKPDRKGTCAITNLDADGLTLRVDREGMQALFDDVYDAALEEQQRDKPFQNKRTKEDVPPKRTSVVTVVDKKGNTKTKNVYIYDQTVPRGGIIGEWDAAPAGAEKLWLKLWRDLVWTTLRGVPATREPYEQRANAEPASDGLEAWAELANEPLASVSLPSTYYLGAQATTAENVPFRDAAHTRVLLHFWPFAIPIYVPEVVDRDGSRDFAGYAIVMPDIIDLEAFVVDWPKLARARGSEVAGYVPRDAVVALPAEASLDLARRAREVIAEREGLSTTRSWLTAADVFHVEKEGNNVRMRSTGRIELERSRVDEYSRVRSSYWSPEFRRRRILNILDGRPWWHGFARVCATTGKEQTIEDSKFRHDCRIAFTEVEMSEAVNGEEPTLEQRVYRMIRSFVSQRTASKFGSEWSWERVKGTGREEEFNQKRGKIAREAFLAVRSRTGSDFVSYFTSTLCSVPQHLGEAGFVEVARALHDEAQVERVRSLTLLALSTNS